MRVIHVITRLIVGGAQENTIASVLGLQRKPGLELDLLSGPTFGAEGSLEPYYKKSGGKLTIIPSLVRPVHPLKDWRALQQLTGYFQNVRPDIVHTHSGKAGILGRLAARKANVPIIIHTIHGPSFGPFQGLLPNQIFLSAERYAAKVTTHFVSVANAMTEQYLAAGIGRREQFTRIFSGFSLSPFLSAKNDLALRAKLGLAPDDFVVGKIARLFKLKGHDDLFAIAPKMIERCPRIKFLLVGDGPWRSRFKNKTQQLGLEKHFVFTGLIPPVEVPAYVGVMDMLVHLSMREGLPRALPQALAAAKPVVAYDCDGAKEICRENETGFLVRPGDFTNLTERILQLASDGTLRGRLGQCGQILVQKNFPVEKMVDDLHSLYLKLETQNPKSKTEANDFSI